MSAAITPRERVWEAISSQQPDAGTMTKSSYVLCVTLNPVLDTTYFVEEMRPVYRTEARRVTHIAGGKGNNVARALGVLGVPAVSLVALGGMIGRNVAEVLKDDPFQAAPVWMDGETRLQITVIDAQGMQRAFYAPCSEFSMQDAERAVESFESLVGEASGVCVCGSSPGVAADPLYRRFTARGREQGVLTVLDTYSEALREGLAARPHVVKVNLAEAEGFLGRKIEGRAAEQGAVGLLREAGAHIAVLTLGEQGSLLATKEGIWQAAPPPVRALNPIGSGDAMTAGLVAALLRGDPPLEALCAGMAVAAGNTLTWEACRFDPDEIPRLMPAVEIRQLEGAH